MAVNNKYIKAVKIKIMIYYILGYYKLENRLETSQRRDLLLICSMCVSLCSMYLLLSTLYFPSYLIVFMWFQVEWLFVLFTIFFSQCFVLFLD